MNLNRMLVISLGVLLISSYQTDSSLMFSMLMKMLMVKGALFMSMPLSIGAFVMGQGMGFFAGNMMGSYMMLRAANTYHNKEKNKWVSYSNWHGPPFQTNNYQKGYDSGKAISDALSAGKAKVSAIASIFKAFRPSLPKRPPKRPVYGPPPSHSHGGWSSGYESYASYSNPQTTAVVPSSYPYPSDPYGAPAPAPQASPAYDNMFKLSESPLTFQEYYPGGNRKNTFSTILSELAGGNEQGVDQNSIRRVQTTTQPKSPSSFYTSAYTIPGQEFTGILTNEPSSQGDMYLRGESESLNNEATATARTTTVSPPNEILEGYLEQRLKQEAEKQKDMEKKQEVQQLVQLLRKAYLKQLVDSLKEEETKTAATNRQLSSLTSSIESLFGSRESRSIEQKQDEAGPSAQRQSSKNLIRDLLINEVFTSGESPKGATSTADDKIDTAEAESITERILSLTSTEREELVKGLDEFEDEEGVIGKPAEDITTTTERVGDILVSSTENSITDSNEGGEDKKPEARGSVLHTLFPAHWIPADNTFQSESIPFSIRVRRQIRRADGMESVSPQVANMGQGASVTPPQVGTEEQKQIQTFVNDIRKFFTLLSALDQDTCLQKLVCDVHTNEKDLSTLTQYEQNILTTFRLMKALMPEGEEDSSTKYRYAAVVGETGQSMELCQQTYPSCGYSTSQIVALGTQEEATPADWANAQSQAATTAASVPMQMQPQAVVPSVLQPVETQEYKQPEVPVVRQPESHAEDYVADSPPPMTRRKYQTQEHYHRRHNHHQSQYPSRQPNPDSPSLNNFFNYGEFFRSMWSDTLMGRTSRRSRQYFKH